MNNILEISKHLNEISKELRTLQKEVKEKNEIISKLRNKSEVFYSDKIEYNDVSKLNGKKIDTVSVFSAEYGRTYDTYIGFKCNDGTRVMIAGSGWLYYPEPELKDMIASGFYHDNEIEKVKIYIDNDEKQKERDTLASKKASLKKLQDELAGK